MLSNINNNARILVLGDSIVEGDGSSDGRWWVGIIREKYWWKWPWITNLWISWDTSFDLLKRIGAVSGYRPDTIVFAIGINDCCIARKMGNEPISSLEDFRANMGEILHRCWQWWTDLKIIWLTRVDESRVQPFPWSKSQKSYYNDLIHSYDAELQSIANDYDCEYIAVADVLNRDDLIDGLHPNDTGYKKLAEYLEKFIVSE